MIKISHRGSLNKTENFVLKLSKRDYLKVLNYYGKLGVEALSEATPKDTGRTAASWDYKVIQNRSSSRIVFTNSNVVDGYPIAILLQYGHGTKNGGWVEGRDYINPAIQPIFDEIANNMWKEVHG